ncbi:MAG TPA: Asp-tRNA(Asn)/Glu-tRNA(Gln) amidotransferase subunit GatC [Candidatus Paceibacterota bacterium]|nr:Asp-tRNA(Asn)/Glu-tRNA(Gln) amidotransferase subunit GatC [Candidatus Paceibacterota bacterium]
MISKEEVEQLAALARLEVTPREVESLQKDISNILGYVGQVAAVSVDSKEPEVPLVHNVLRNDVPRAAGDTMAGKEAELVAAFPKREGTFNVVRKIIQKDE